MALFSCLLPILDACAYNSKEREAVEPLLNPLRELLVAIDAVVKTVLVSSTIITFIQFTVAET